VSVRNSRPASSREKAFSTSRTNGRDDDGISLAVKRITPNILAGRAEGWEKTVRWSAVQLALDELGIPGMMPSKSLERLLLDVKLLALVSLL
jgi:hypothetical protein